MLIAMSAFSLSALFSEARHNLRLAWPLIGAQIAFVSMGTVDTILAGRLGARELAAVAVGANIWFLAFVVFMGLSLAITPIVAQRVGAGRPAEETGAFVRSALRVGFLFGIAWTAFTFLVNATVLDLLDLDPVTRAYAGDYVRAVAWSGVPFAWCFVLRNTAEAHGLTRAPLVAGIVGLSVNALFGWALMYGRWGAPRLGPEGAAWASVLAGIAMLGTYLVLYGRVSMLRSLAIWGPASPAWLRDAREILRLGVPVAAVVSAEAWLFMFGALMMARFGAEAIAAHQIAINVASMSFMVPMAIGLATSVRVGHAAGAGDVAGVATRGRAGILLGAGFALLSATAMAVFSEVIVGLYTSVETVSALAVNFLAFAAVFQLFDCVQATSNGALRGIKDTRGPMIVTVAAYWMLGMPLAAWLAFGGPAGPQGIWWGFIAGLGVAAIGLCGRFLAKAPAKAGAIRSAVIP